VEVVVRDADPFDGSAVGQHARSKHVQRAAAQNDLAVAHHVGVRQISGERTVILGDGRTEQQRFTAAEAQLEAGEKSSAGMIEPVRTPRSGNDVAVRIVDAEGIVPLENAHRCGGALRLADDRKLLFEFQYVGHQTTPVSARPEDPRASNISYSAT
jgi:hypothetical protein